MNTGLWNAPRREIRETTKGASDAMNTVCFGKTLCLLVLTALFGCAGVLQEEPVKLREPSAPQAAVSPPPAAPVADEAETARIQAKEMLLGKWVRIQGADTIEFLADDTISLFSAVERVAYPGTYRIIDKQQVEITMKKGDPRTWGYALTKGELTLTTPTGVNMKYKRHRGK